MLSLILTASLMGCQFEEAAIGGGLAPLLASADAGPGIVDSAIGLFKLMTVCSTILMLAFFVLLSMPKSYLRCILLEMVSWTSMFVSGVYIISPIDVIPDVIPVVGWVDDLGAAASGAASIGTALYQRRQRKLLEVESN